MNLFFTIAMRNLLQAKRRTLLLGSAIALVTFIHIGLQSISNGYMQGLVNGATSIAAGHINIVGLYKHNASTMYPLLTNTSTVIDVIENEFPEVDSVVDRNSTVGKMVGGKRSLFLFLQGIQILNEKKLRTVLKPAMGDDGFGGLEPLGDIDSIREKNTVLLFEAQAKKLNVTVGDHLLFDTPTVLGTNVVSLKVGAIVEDVGMVSQLFTFASRETVKELMQIDDDVSARILIYLNDQEKAVDVMNRLRARLIEENFEFTEYQPSSLFRRWVNVERQDWMGQRLDMTTWEDNLSEAKVVVNAIQGVSYVLLTILSIIIAIGIMNTIWISARERTNEIGCIRAIGMSSRQVMLMFMLEAMMMGLLGAAIGGFLGFGLVEMIATAEIPIRNEAMRVILFANKVNLDISLLEVVYAIMAFALVTSLAALFPSIRAARIQPIQAINHIE